MDGDDCVDVDGVTYTWSIKGHTAAQLCELVSLSGWALNSERDGTLRVTCEEALREDPMATPEQVRDIIAEATEEYAAEKAYQARL